VLAEPVMLALGEVIGPRRAHALVHAAAARGRAEGLSFRDALAADPEIRDVDLDELLRVESALGAARELVDRVLR
jgi:Adenylosuccinate lyase C-terminus